MKYTEIDKDTAEIKFHGYIGTWWINGTDFDNTISEIKARYKNLNIRVHCYGGEVFEGFVIYNALKRSGLTVKFYVDGVAASMMTIVMFAGNEVYMVDNTFQMFHAPKGGVYGNAKDAFGMGKLLKNMEEIFVKGLVAKSGMQKSDAEKYLDGTDYWLTAQECLDLKIITGIIPSNGDIATLEKPQQGTPVEQIFGHYAAVLAVDTNNNHPKTQSSMTKEAKQALIDKHGLTGVTADSSDTAVLEAVNEKIAKLTATNASLEKSVGENLTAQVNTILAAKETTLKKQFTTQEKDNYQQYAKSMGVDKLVALLDQLTPTPVIASMINNGTGSSAAAPGADKAVIAEDRKTWSLQDWQDKDPEGLEKMSKAAEGSPELMAFHKLYNAAYKTNLPEA